MKDSLIHVGCAVLAGLASSCGPDVSPSSGQPPAASRPPLSAPSGAEILTIRFRDRLVEVVKGADGVRYNVLGLDGAAVATGLTRDELAARFPREANAVETGVAADGVILDARHYPAERASVEREAPTGRLPAAGRRPAGDY